MKFVVDSSFIAKLVMPDEVTPEALALAPALFAAGTVAPALLRFEFANLLRSNVRRGRIAVTSLDRLYGTFQSMPIDLFWSDSHAITREILQLAVEHELTAYDAAYLELSIRLNATLVSLDADLVKAARASNVAVAL